VKTTPNPRATKNSRGELVGPPGWLDAEVVALGTADVVDEGVDMIAHSSESYATTEDAIKSKSDDCEDRCCNSMTEERYAKPMEAMLVRVTKDLRSQFVYRCCVAVK